jgi:hypothetical protein
MENAQKLSILKNAKNRIATRSTWCQYAPAVSATNHSVLAISPEARKWDLSSAVWLAYPECTASEDMLQVHLELTQDAKKLFPSRALLYVVNDELGFDAVHKLLDATISRIESLPPDPVQLSFNF